MQRVPRAPGISRRRFVGGLSAVAAMGTVGLSWADPAWPSRPLRIVVPAGPGSVPDVRSRWLADRLGSLIGQAVIVENRPGAGGTIAMEAAARANADGHTMVMTNTTLMSVRNLLHARPRVDAQRDFIMVTRVGVGPLLLLVNPDAPWRTLADLVQGGRERLLTLASPGVGTPPHVAALLLMRESGIRSTHVPYSNPTQPIADLLGSQVDWLLEGTPVALPLARAGRVRALAVTGEQRLRALPEVPTVGEAGFSKAVYTAWSGPAVLSSTPPAIVQRLYDALHRVLSSDEASQWFGDVGNEPGGESPQTMAEIVRDEQARFGPVLRAAGFGER